MYFFVLTRYSAVIHIPAAKLSFMPVRNNFQTAACNPCHVAAVCHALISMLPNSGGNFIQNGLYWCLSGGKYAQMPINDES
jgi:hypothetical protein